MQPNPQLSIVIDFQHNGFPTGHVAWQWLNGRCTRNGTARTVVNALLDARQAYDAWLVEHSQNPELFPFPEIKDGLE